MKLSQLTHALPTEATIDVLGEPVKVIYDRARITGTFWKEASPWRDKLARILISWDIVDETTGKPYMPPESANGSRPALWVTLFEPIPDDLLLAIWNGIFDDNRAGPKVGAGSTAT
jgi:hypothetical protein